ncbi:MAG: TIGR00266 family protein, partial [Thermoprotei archaeon]
TYRARSKAEVWFAPSLPGDILYIPLNGDSWIVQDSSYLAHHGDIEVGIAWRGFRGLLAEGELFWLRLRGYGGVWVNAYGGLEKLEVPAGEKVTIDNFHFVAMSEDVDYSIRKFGGWKSFLLGGEGVVFDVRGPATIYLQTRIIPPFARLLRKFLKTS